MGKCADGKQYVDPNFVKLLVNMGFSKEAARVALQQTNNIISDSVQYMQEHPQAGPSKTKSKEMLALIDDLIPEVFSLCLKRPAEILKCFLFSSKLLALTRQWPDWP